MNLVELSVLKCHLTYSIENPGMEKGMCAGLRTLNGEGEPCEECKECGLYYGYAEEHDIKKTNADWIRSMSDEELADFIERFGTFNQPCNISCGKTLEWLKSEVEESDEHKTDFIQHRHGSSNYGREKDSDEACNKAEI